MREILKSCRKHKFSDLLMMLQIVLVISYFFMTVASIQKAFHICMEVPNILGDKYDRIIHCEVQDDGTDRSEFNKFLGLLKKNKIIDDIGYYDSNADIESESFGNEEIANLRMELGISRIADFRMQEGRNFKEEDLQDKIMPLLAGHELAETYNVKIGDIIEDEYRDEKYKVIGILKKGSCWFKQTVSEGLTLSLDTQVVTLTSTERAEKDIQQHYYGIADSTMTTKQAVKKINDMAAENSHIILKAAALSDKLDQQFDKIWDENIYWLIFSVLIMAIVAIGTASLSVSHLYTRKKEVGIRMALGYSPKRIFFLFAGKIIILTLVSYGISCFIGVLMIGDGITDLGDMVMHTGYAFTGKIALFGGIGAAVMCFPSLLVLAVVVRKFQPKNLIGGKE